MNGSYWRMGGTRSRFSSTFVSYNEQEIEKEKMEFMKRIYIRHRLSSSIGKNG